METSRRELLKTIAGATAFGVASAPVASWGADARKGRIKQSVAAWCYGGYMKKNNISMEQFIASCSEIGLKSVEMIGEEHWPLLKKNNMVCAMISTHSSGKGLNRAENHDSCLDSIRKKIDTAATWGYPNVITFSGNCGGLDKQEGLEQCVIALKKIAPYAEEKKVTICLEFFNSINHKDYMADTTVWCAELVNRVNSPRVKVLYDIYHAAMMKENPLVDIQKHGACWGHYHTAGVPGRGDIDPGIQTLDYVAIAKAIADSGYTGFLGQEFSPKNADALQSLRNAVKLCDV
jgi:hydroxypyruvate isomerase